MDATARHLLAPTCHLNLRPDGSSSARTGRSGLEPPATGVPIASREGAASSPASRRTVALHQGEDLGAGRSESADVRLRPGLYPVVLVVALLLLIPGSARATCDYGVFITQGMDGGTLDAATCGTSPSAVFWLIGHGNPVAGTGIDSGTHTGLVYPITGGGQYWTSDWGNAGVDGCPIAQLQGDGTLGPMAVLITQGAGEGTSSHGGTYVLLSADHDEMLQFYNLDLAAAWNVTCAPIPVPAIGDSVPNGGGGFDLELNWAGVSNLLDDCATNPAIGSDDCLAEEHRALLSGWAVYSREDNCLPGPLTGDRDSWTLAATLPPGGNLAAEVSIPGTASGKCRFVAVAPVWESGMQGQFLSGHAGPVGGTGDADGDGVADFQDNCASVPNTGQADGDGDRIGDTCDNCPLVANQTQADADADSLGDACDPCPADPANDEDEDGLCGGVDNCPGVYNPSQVDADDDGLGDLCDPCPDDPANDADGDGLCSGEDNCPTHYNPAQTDTDSDALGDPCDPCRYEKHNPLSACIDNDCDLICSCDPVLLNLGACAGVAGLDNCPRVSNPGQEPSGKNDGLGADCEDRFGAVEILPAVGEGYGACRIRFKTLNEWNCPMFQVVYRGPGGDRPTGVTFPCLLCTRGIGRTGIYYGGTSGLYVKYCHGGYNIFVQAVRSNPNRCSGFVVPGTAAAVRVEAAATRVR